MTTKKTRAITTRQPGQYLPVPITKEQAMYLLKTIWPKAPETEVRKAGILCQQYGLNPLMRQVYLVQFGQEWVTILGIKATRQIAQQALRKLGIRYSYADGPRVMTEKEQMKIRGKIEPDKIWAITILNDQTGNIYPGYGWWPANKQPYGTDKGNDAFNMAFIRSERSALDKLAPGELPDIEVGDDTYIEGDYRVTIEKGQEQFLNQVQQDIDGLFGKETPQMKALRESGQPHAQTSTPDSGKNNGIAEESRSNPIDERQEAPENEDDLGIDMDWVRETQKIVRWNDAVIKSWMAVNLKVEAIGELADIIKSLPKDKLEKLVKKLEALREVSGQ